MESRMFKANDICTQIRCQYNTRTWVSRRGSDTIAARKDLGVYEPSSGVAWWGGREWRARAGAGGVGPEAGRATPFVISTEYTVVSTNFFRPQTNHIVGPIPFLNSKAIVCSNLWLPLQLLLEHLSCPFMLYAPIHHITQPSLHFLRKFCRCPVRTGWDVNVSSTVMNRRDRGNEPLQNI